MLLLLSALLTADNPGGIPLGGSADKVCGQLGFKSSGSIPEACEFTNAIKKAYPRGACLFSDDDKHKQNGEQRLEESRSFWTAGRAGVFFKKGDDFNSDIFRRQAMSVIRIENETVVFLGDFEGVA
jgi:hypothetical protein